MLPPIPGPHPSASPSQSNPPALLQRTSNELLDNWRKRQSKQKEEEFREHTDSTKIKFREERVSQSSYFMIIYSLSHMPTCLPLSSTSLSLFLSFSLIYYLLFIHACILPLLIKSQIELQSNLRIRKLSKLHFWKHLLSSNISTLTLPKDNLYLSPSRSPNSYSPQAHLCFSTFSLTSRFPHPRPPSLPASTHTRLAH